MELLLKLTITEIKERFAKDLGIDPKNVKLQIEGELAPSIAKEAVEEDKPQEETFPCQTKEIPHSTKKKYFLRAFLGEHKLRDEDAAELCGVSRSSISRAANGNRMRPEIYLKIVRGLELTDEQAKLFEQSIGIYGRKKGN